MVEKIKKAIILSAGFGSRLKPLTDKIPKALVEVCGVPMLDREIDMLKKAGVNEIYLNTHCLAEEIENYIKKANYSINVAIIYEADILGTGGSIYNVLKNYTEGPIFVVNCDVLFYHSDPLDQLMKNWQGDKMEILALLQKKKDGRKGDFDLTASGNLLRSEKEMDYIFAGCYIVANNFFKADIKGFFSITDILFKYSDKYFGIENEGDWMDIGTLSDLELANQVMCNLNV